MNLSLKVSHNTTVISVRKIPSVTITCAPAFQPCIHVFLNRPLLLIHTCSHILKPYLHIPLLEYSPYFRSKLHFSKAHPAQCLLFYTQRKQCDYRWTDLASTEQKQTGCFNTDLRETYSVHRMERDSVEPTMWKRILSLLSVDNVDTHERFRVQIVGSIFHDHPICQGLGL